MSAGYLIFNINWMLFKIENMLHQINHNLLFILVLCYIWTMVFNTSRWRVDATSQLKSIGLVCLNDQNIQLLNIRESIYSHCYNKWGQHIHIKSVDLFFTRRLENFEKVKTISFLRPLIFVPIVALFTWFTWSSMLFIKLSLIHKWKWKAVYSRLYYHDTWIVSKSICI